MELLKKIIRSLPRRRRQEEVLLSTCMRTGSTWVYRLLGQLFQENMANFEFFRVDALKNGSAARQRCREALAVMDSKPGCSVFKTHRVPVNAMALLLEAKADLKIINVHRDFKDVLISRLFYDRYRRGKEGGDKRMAWIAEYDDMTDEQMVNAFVGTPQYDKLLKDWASYHIPFEHDRYLVLQYEQMVEAYEANVDKLADFIGVWDKSIIAKAMENCHFSKMATDVKGRVQGDIVKHDHCRKGIAGDYKTYMTEETILRCNADIQKALNSAPVPNPQWIKNAFKRLNQRTTGVEVTDPKVPAVIAIPPSDAAEKTFVVLGCARGGTSMVAGILRVMGIWMGDNLGHQQENKAAFGKDIPFKTKIAKIQEYNALYPRWGWKHPATFEWIEKAADKIRNPHLIVVYRNPIDVSLSFVNRGDQLFSDQLVAAQLNRYQRIQKVLSNMQAPSLYISFDRSIQRKEQLIEQLADFTGTELVDDMRLKISNFIDPEKGYQRL